MKILLFQIGRETFGMELKNIVKIAFYTELEPGSESGQIINWQRNAIPVIDLCQMLQTGEGTTEKRVFIILSLHNRLGAVPVDHAEEICDVAYDRVIPISNMILSKKENRIFSGIVVLQNNVIPLIDHSMLFQ
ncbi:chemotaxis protein CheW [Candidatus Ventrimonas sp. KK005]